MEIKAKDINAILESYEKIPLRETKTTLQNALDDIKDMLDILEKDINGQLDGSEKNRMEYKKDDWYDSIYVIKKYLEEKGILTSRGKTTWSKRSIETMLTNEKYVGDVILYKTFSPNFPEKKRIQNNGEHKKYIQEDHHPAIISREMFKAVQEMRESRSNIERHADGTVTRKAKRYTGKKE